jgi:hypothetical protein
MPNRIKRFHTLVGAANVPKHRVGFAAGRFVHSGKIRYPNDANSSAKCDATTVDIARSQGILLHDA